MALRAARQRRRYRPDAPRRPLARRVRSSRGPITTSSSSCRPALLGLAIAPMLVDFRSNMQKLVLDQLLTGFGTGQVMRGVRIDVSVAEAFACGRPLRRCRPDARAVADFCAVADDVIRRFNLAAAHATRRSAFRCFFDELFGLVGRAARPRLIFIDDGADVHDRPLNRSTGLRSSRSDRSGSPSAAGEHAVMADAGLHVVALEIGAEAEAHVRGRRPSRRRRSVVALALDGEQHGAADRARVDRRAAIFELAERQRVLLEISRTVSR